MKQPSSILFLLFFPFVSWSQIYVAPNGADSNAGTQASPVASVAMALRKAREWRRLHDPAAANGLHIYVANGIYHLSEPLFIRPEDAGTETGVTTIEALPGAKPVLSGGINVGGWKKLTTPVKALSKKAQQQVWVTDAPTVSGQWLDFRQLWVNDAKAVRARDRDEAHLHRILSWNKKTGQCWIPKPAVPLSGINGLEFFIHQWWAIAVLRVKSVDVKGDSALLSFYQPESRIQSEHPWPSPWISSETGNSAFYLSNILEFLDEPGEWYLDKTAHRLYYWPRAGENLNTATVVAPVLETLVKAEGTPERNLSSIHFKGISFQHTTWMRPSQQGHVALQAGMYLLDAYKLKVPGTPEKKTLENQAWVGRPAAAVNLRYATNIQFENCRFEHLASTALDAEKGVRNALFRGNVFKDIGGSAFVAGVFSDEAMETHLPYSPADKREVTEGITISNNVITNAANEDWGCVGIAAGFVKETTIAHNDLSELPYTGISLGWGWTNAANAMQNNKIIGNRIVRYGRQMYDVAGIYTLSAQPASLIAENYIDSIYKAPYAHLPHHWFYLYTDEGSSGITVKNNWTPSEKFLQNANGPGNVWENNGPAVADSIRQKAGVQEPFRSLLQEKVAVNNKQAINHELPVIVEVINKPGQPVNLDTLKRVLAENGIASPALYQWKHHVVLFNKVSDAAVLQGRLAKAFPGAQVKLYDNAFYEFNRQRCSDTGTAREWGHVLLTANLVADPKMQKEYLDYHATQFEQWPELSKGFCNADFQQLLVYKNGRQLMLVISIPKGASLDQLNPKTTENNPKVVQWNNLMKKYQEGIEGTAPGEGWVFLKKVSSE
ncbi:L-rhamnose mutarotase [Flavisolibacter nicotianae]|uniref:L-rhamnose mutarotase n=1 Tax=Flavisolibacter nicotianae TaxID=2364882 RepID=UPI000EB5519A|nr:L-rhamnose mutarotase [Flavisolibacter nicotianae]